MIYTMLNEYQVSFQHIDFAEGTKPAKSAVLGQHELGKRYRGNGVWEDFTPPEKVPFSVTRRQAKQGLLLAGKLDDVQPAINSIPDEIQRRMAQLYWDESQDFERDNEVLQMMAQAIGMTPDEVDNLFIQASKL